VGSSGYNSMADTIILLMLYVLAMYS
jgi:hypothetical protein